MPRDIDVAVWSPQTKARPIAASKRPQAERAGEHALIHNYHCVLTRRALRTKFAKVDFWASDAMGIRQDGTKVFCQVTAGQSECVRTRRRKLEKVPWHSTDTVLVLQLVERQSPINARRKDWFFRVHQYQRGEWNDVSETITVKPEWFKAYRETE